MSKSTEKRCKNSHLVRIDRMCLRLCKRCLLELVGEAANFLSNEEVSNNLCGESEFLKWNDLTKAEQEQAKETYIRIREDEEERDRNEITNDYPEPIDSTGVEGCSFERQADGYIDVII